MRKFLALVLAVVFLLTFFAAVTVSHVVNSVSEPEVVMGMLNDAEVFGYVYENVLPNLFHDLISKGVKVNSGLGDSPDSTTLNFDDPDAAAAAITSSFETLVPREYLRQKTWEGLVAWFPYLAGKTDEFTVDLQVQERVRAVPDSVRVLVLELNLIKQVTDDLLIPQVSELTSNITDNALGIRFTEQENENNTRDIFAPDWVEQQLFDAVDEITPYFAGDTTSFEIKIEFDDRVVIIGEILKDKIEAEDTLYQLVFAKVIDPAIQKTVDQSTSVGFGVSLSEQEVMDAVEVIAPREWVRGHGDAVIDLLVEYLLGNSDDLSYSIDMSERKTAAVEELQALARTKLVRTLEVLPTCGSSTERLSATKAVLSGQVPPCLSGGPMINMALNAFVPKMDHQVEAFIVEQIPGEISYSLAEFASEPGGTENPFEDARKRVVEGVTFTEQDLLDIMSDENNPESRVDAEEKLKILAAGVVITEKNIIETLGADASQQLDDVRGFVKLGLFLKSLLWVGVLALLVIIAFVGGGSWLGRLKWAGGVAAICALAVFGVITLGWSAVTSQLPHDVPVSQEMKIDFPQLSTELESGAPIGRIELALGSWRNGWRNQTVPWVIAGLAALTIGIVWPRINAKRELSTGGEPVPDANPDVKNDVDKESSLVSDR